MKSNSRTVLVGIAPARAGDEGQPLSAVAPQSTGRRLANLIGVSALDYMRAFDRVNVCPFPQPSTIKPKEWRAAAENLAGSLLRDRRVILLGPNVAECFGIKRSVYEFLLWHEKRNVHRGVLGFRAGQTLPFSWAVMPHLSGRNHWYNDANNVCEAAEFLNKEYSS